MAVNLTGISTAVAAMAGVLGDGMTADMTGPHFSCTEANVLADVLIQAGYRDAAETWLLGHGAGDDSEDDDHAALYEMAKSGGPYDSDAAVAWVRTYIAESF